MAVGSSRPLEDTRRIGQVEMVDWLRDPHGLDTLDAYRLLSQVSEAPLANVVDANRDESCRGWRAYPRRPILDSPAGGDLLLLTYSDRVSGVYA